MMVARPRPTPIHISTKSSAPSATPTARSAIAARLTSFSIVTGWPRSVRSASSTPSCQAGRLTASHGSPVRGSSTPGVPMTSALSWDIATPAALHAVATAPRTSSTGLLVPFGSTLTWVTTWPVMSATPALTSSCSTCSPAT